VKFTPKVKPITSGNNLKNSRLVPVSIERISPLISAKSSKEVNQISKYFKNLKPTPIVKSNPKSYLQASKPVSYTEEVIKIKNIFPALSTKKINQIQNIVKGGPKPKLQIQMTTKGLFRKQVIIPMNVDNIANFMKESSQHVSNINKILKNAKSDILADFT